VLYNRTEHCQGFFICQVKLAEETYRAMHNKYNARAFPVQHSASLPLKTHKNITRKLVLP